MKPSRFSAQLALPHSQQNPFFQRNFNFTAVHGLGAERLARISAQSGVSRFVHVSHLNADLHSPSQFYQSKAEGEELVKQAFDGPTIIRPSAMFGYEDKLLNNIASERNVVFAFYLADT